ncbi:MAG: zf-HC2 domain-containing protein [Ignavibacteriales bacterium]|nr:zf-HC2 domain-containing protein [Ignavibacteriales bacterium]
MNHKKIQLLVSSYLDGEVNESEKAEALSHLEVCPECRRFIEQAKLMRENICALGEVELANSFAAHVAYSVEKRDEQTVEWLGIEPSARNTFILLATLVLILFFFTSYNNNTGSAMNDQLLNKITSNSVSTQVLLQQENLSKSDLLYAVMTK